MGKRINTAAWIESRKRWQIKVQKEGERRTFYSFAPGRTGQREANKKADAWLDEGIENEHARISMLYDKYFGQVKITTSKGNWKQIESLWRVWITPAIGRKKISALNEQHIQNIIDSAQAAGLSKKTQKNILNTINSFLKFCRKSKCTTLRAENVSIPQSARYRGKTILQPHDIIKLFNSDKTFLGGKACFDEFIYAYRFQVLTGLRPGELMGLRWSDLKERMLLVQRSINLYGEETKGKNENAVRSLYVSDMAYSCLEEQRKLTGGEESIFGIGSLSGYEKRWKRYMEHNKLTKTTPYEMRHTFVSVVKALPAGQIKGLVGHSQNMDTFGVYGHAIQGEEKRTSESINAIFSEIILGETQG